MSYDFDSATDRSPPVVTTFVPDPHDLESIVTLLELGALDLTKRPGDEFTFEELFAKAQEMGVLYEADVRIVLPFVKFLSKRGKRYQLR